MASLSNNTRMTFQQFRAKMQEERRLKRTRVKSSIPAHKRCSALRKDGEKCTRRRKDESIFCGTHIKGTPHAKKSVIHSAFEDNSDPAKGISLVIPRVFNNIGWRRIKQIFINKNLKCRILERGQVSEEGWGKHKPDNVPGRKSLYMKSDYNMLINYRDIEFDKEEVKEIYLFKSSLIGNKIKLVEPTLNIQKTKKIEGLIDYDDFKRNNSEYYFTTLDNLYNFVERI